MLKKGISFSIRRGTVAQVIAALDTAQHAQHALEDELALNDAGLPR
jgi:hypothetical protein